MNATLQYLIEAPQAFSTIFANATTNPPKQLSETSNQIILQTTSTFFPIKNLSFSQPNIVTFDILENRLQSLINNLTTDKNSSKDFKVSAGNKVTESQTANSDFLSNSPFLTQLQSNVDVLNTTVAVQGSMLQQAIGALGDYDRRYIKKFPIYFQFTKACLNLTSLLKIVARKIFSSFITIVNF